MEFELHIKGTIEEISQITNLIEKKLERDRSMFDCLRPSPVTEMKSTHPKTRSGRAVDILMGSYESWFAPWKSYNSIQAAAQSLGLKEAANIYAYLKNWTAYKGIYKFQYRDL